MNGGVRSGSNRHPGATLPACGIDGYPNDLPSRGNPMTDPRNVAHDKKVQQEKKHQGEDIAPDAEHAPQPGKKPALKEHDEQADDKA